MGYTTDFEGNFDLNKQLSAEHSQYLRQFSETRRMARDAKKAEKMPDPVRLAVGLPIGPEGAYFVGGTGCAGQDRDASIIEYNNEPYGQPGLWCQWVPTRDDRGIEWNGTEKFYNYVEWLQYLITHFLGPWGYVVNGRVSWRGEDHSDVGVLVVKNNVVTANPVTFKDEDEEEVPEAADTTQLKQEHPAATAERQRVLNLFRAAAKRYATAPHTLYTSQLLLEEIERIQTEG